MSDGTVGMHPGEEDPDEVYGDPDETDLGEMFEEMRSQPEREHQWYCPSCRIVVPWNHATHEETHDVRAGGCGAKLWWKPKDDTQEPAGQQESERVEPGYIVLIRKALKMLPDSSERRNALVSMAILEATVSENAALLKQVEEEREKPDAVRISNRNMLAVIDKLEARVESLERVKEAADGYLEELSTGHRDTKTDAALEHLDAELCHAREHLEGE